MARKMIAPWRVTPHWKAWNLYDNDYLLSVAQLFLINTSCSGKEGVNMVCPTIFRHQRAIVRCSALMRLIFAHQYIL